MLGSRRPRRAATVLVFGGWLVIGVAACGGDDRNAAPDAAATGAAHGTERVSADTPAWEGPELVAPGVVSLPDRNETFPAEDPVTGDLWFSVYENSFDAQTIMVARRGGEVWSEAEVAPFSGSFGDRAPRFSPDGSVLYFTSNRLAPGMPDGDMNIWRVERTDAGWSEPSLVPDPVSTTANDIHPSITNTAIWVASSRDGGLGRSDVFRVAPDGSVRHPAAPINDELSQPDLWVSPDESWMILVVTEHPDGLGGDDLFVLRRQGDAWGTPVQAGPELNSEEYEYGPTLSADGRHVYFTSHRGGTADVYRAPVERFRDLDGDGHAE